MPSIRPLAKLISDALNRNNISFRYQPAYYDRDLGVFVIWLLKTPYTIKIRYDYSNNMVEIEDNTPFGHGHFPSPLTRYSLADPDLFKKIPQRIEKISNSFEIHNRPWLQLL
jgi:hypothetical protein